MKKDYLLVFRYWRLGSEIVHQFSWTQFRLIKEWYVNLLQHMWRCLTT